MNEERLYLDGRKIPTPMSGLNLSLKPSLVIHKPCGITNHYGLPLTTSNTQLTLSLTKRLMLLLGLNVHGLH